MSWDQDGECFLGFEAINLDDVTSDPKDLDALAKGLKLLSEYAERKAGAMRCRKAGNVEEALRLEASCDRRYAALPAWARW
jgi:hypothetical protein